jgi:Arc/MetJ-type ribon-helix-helix transcriptional regulator
MYGMRRTTVYLPDELKRAIERVARGEDESEASFIRRALEKAVDEAQRPQPRLPLFSSGDSRLAEHVDEALAGFGVK